MEDFFGVVTFRIWPGIVRLRIRDTVRTLFQSISGTYKIIEVENVYSGLRDLQVVELA